MSYSKKETKEYILNEFLSNKIKYEIYDFESGASMIHVWIKNKFYAIQLEIESFAFVGSQASTSTSRCWYAAEVNEHRRTNNIAPLTLPQTKY